MLALLKEVLQTERLRHSFPGLSRQSDCEPGGLNNRNVLSHSLETRSLKSWLLGPAPSETWMGDSSLVLPGSGGLTQVLGVLWPGAKALPSLVSSSQSTLPWVSKFSFSSCQDNGHTG